MSSLPITIYEYIKMDHQKVADLFSQFEKSDLQERKKEIITMIMKELVLHNHSEQDTFYKALEKHYESESEALHGRKEHAEVDEQIKLIADSMSFGAAWEKKVFKLKEMIDHHVKEEESDVFKKAKKVLSDEEALALKEQMHYRKGQLLAQIKE